MSPTWYIAGNERPFGSALSSPLRGYAFQGSGSTTVASDTATFSINFGNAQSDRYLVVGLSASSSVTSIVSVVANGVTLNQDASNPNSYVYSGLVTTGTGTQNIVVTTTGGSGLERNVFVWRLTGLIANNVKNTASGPGNHVAMTISVNANDFMFAVATGATSENFPSSTQAPAETLSSGALGSAGDWLISANNASFSIGSTAGVKPEIAATYT